MRALAATLLAACSFSHGRLAPGDGGGDGDGRRDADSGDAAGTDAMASSLRAKTITISSVTGNHTDFPLWVLLDDTDLAARARADAADLHFTTSTGTPLDFQIQRWTQANGHLEAWVRVPTLATGREIQVRYGDVAAAHAPNAPGVFAEYAAVWHLEDALNDAAIGDAKGAVNGTASGLQSADQISAQLGGGIDFSGAGEQITFVNPLTGNGAHTISLWVNQRATANNDAMVVIGNGQNNQARWFHSRFNTATIAVGFYSNDYANPQEDIQGASWVLLHWVFEGANRMSRLYRGGALVAGPFQHNSGIDTQGTAGYLGNAPAAFGTNMGVTATLDEVRILASARSADWISAEAANQTTPGTFYSVGNELVVP